MLKPWIAQEISKKDRHIGITHPQLQSLNIADEILAHHDRLRIDGLVKDTVAIHMRRLAKLTAVSKLARMHLYDLCNADGTGIVDLPDIRAHTHRIQLFCSHSDHVSISPLIIRSMSSLLNAA